MPTYIAIMQMLTEMKKIGMTVPKKILKMTEAQYTEWTQDCNCMNDADTADMLISNSRYY